MHDGDAVGDRERLLLVVRDIDRGRAIGPLQLADFDAHVDAQLGVEIGQRLIEHQQRRLDHQGPRQRHALLLPTRQARPAGDRPDAPARRAPAWRRRAWRASAGRCRAA